MKFLKWFQSTPPPVSGYEHTIAAFQSTERLASWVLRLTQEVNALQTILREKGLWDEAAFKKAMSQRLIDDHNSTGMSPWKHHSYYPYTQDEASFLKMRCRFSEAEIKQFNEKAEEVSFYT